MFYIEKCLSEVMYESYIIMNSVCFHGNDPIPVQLFHNKNMLQNSSTMIYLLVIFNSSEFKVQPSKNLKSLKNL